MKPVPKIKSPDFEALRLDKTKIPLPTQRERYEANFNVACKMIQDFGYRAWMSGGNVVGNQGQRIDNQGEIYMPNGGAF